MFSNKKINHVIHNYQVLKLNNGWENIMFQMKSCQSDFPILGLKNYFRILHTTVLSVAIFPIFLLYKNASNLLISIPF